MGIHSYASIHIAGAEMHTYTCIRIAGVELHELRTPTDTQIKYANAGMMLVQGFWCQTPGLGTLGAYTDTEAKVEIKHIYICTHFATSINIHILPGV